MLDPLDQILKEKEKTINDRIEQKWAGLKPVFYFSFNSNMLYSS